MRKMRTSIWRRSAVRASVWGGALSLSLGGASAARADSALAWGHNGGKLGNGSTTHSNVPVAVTGLSSGVTAVAGGESHSLAIQNGAAKAWGRGHHGQLGNGSNTDSKVPVDVTGLSSGVTAVAAGYAYSLAIQNGAAKAWGLNSDGQLGNGSTTWSSNVPVDVTGLSSGVTAIEAGRFHSLAIQNGAAKAWGNNVYGQLGNGSTTWSDVPVDVTGLSSGVTSVAAGGYGHSLAIQNGAAKAWGLNSDGQLGNGSTTWSNVPVDVTGLSSGVTAVAAGYEHSLAIQNGNVYKWGTWTAGVGFGATPALVLDQPRDFVDIAATNASSYALSADGSLWVWGYNEYGQLGLGDTRWRDTPTQLLAPAGYRFTGIDGLRDHVVATIAAVPEPGSLALFALGCCVVIGRAVSAAGRPTRPGPT
ncbi:MAG: PEP-CTERM sorting domain-containing protein [Burkholderiales bacterium]|nr:PEP-CTERM sorting domain-containing protein [Burkholderiales bacterium]